MTEERRRVFEEWLATLPAAVREAARERPPWDTYRQKSTGYICHIHSYEGEATCTTAKITITAADNPWSVSLAAFGNRRVFGVPLTDLESVHCFTSQNKEQGK